MPATAEDHVPVDGRAMRVVALGAFPAQTAFPGMGDGCLSSGCHHSVKLKPSTISSLRISSSVLSTSSDLPYRSMLSRCDMSGLLPLAAMRLVMSSFSSVMENGVISCSTRKSSMSAS